MHRPQARFPMAAHPRLSRRSVEDLWGFEDASFSLLVPGGTRAIRIRRLVRAHIVPCIAENDRELARAQISQPSFYLVRPDGHVGLCGPGFDAAAIRRYLADRLKG